jgi:hypothetical protein
MVTTMRVAVGVLGALMIFGGLVAITVGAWPGGLWAILIGCAAIAAVLLERSRYRSDASERTAAQPGPGGGEPTMPTAPFRPTGEVFVDPTSGHRLCVYLNPATGERRYFAEGDRSG